MIPVEVIAQLYLHVGVSGVDDTTHLFQNRLQGLFHDGLPTLDTKIAQKFFISGTMNTFLRWGFTLIQKLKHEHKTYQVCEIAVARQN